MISVKSKLYKYLCNIIHTIIYHFIVDISLFTDLAMRSINLM